MIVQLRRFAPLAVFVGAGFLTAGATDAIGLHGCPHHDRVMGSVSQPGADGGDSMAPMPGHGAAEGPHHAGNDDGHHDGPCTCVGICNAGSSAPPAPHLTLPILTAAELALPPLPADGRGPATRPGGLWALHLPNAPPLSA